MRTKLLNNRDMKRTLILVLKRIWILPATYLVIFELRLNEKYPDAFMLALLVLTVLMIIYDFYKDRNISKQ